MNERPLVLATNDDGIEAPGLWHLAEAVSDFADVLVVAPAFNQSGMSASVTLRRDLETERAHSQLDGVDAWQVNGTPTDAVLHGIRHLAPRHIDMIVSGVNPGPNVGRDILHSGTVMAAMQGYLRNLPSVAASLWSFEEKHLRDAALVAGRIAARLLASDQVQFLNVNAPDLPFAEYTGIRVVPVADVSPSRVIDRIDEDGATHRQLVLRPGAEIAPATDVAAILEGSVTVTPLHNDLTFHARLTDAAGVLGDADALLS
ncbi:MAG: 5'/3'-nucleotidase SurE [Chloroflexi bacterium]|nr:5'/3'-nucleotidase SurE [Chloroflexota bacterium]MCY3697991.1 5'/3'-nucleotidase SurE [Chloroflexota bacterium]MXX32991.1 5'/3'-nucleotidase SurE [Chloroflexota bacterium]MXX81071.1 5'/3'-nucleotidase SurE [Chloroflexota bacterium]MYD17044.1 5'/3'-nucleotidase SurE [Chloroflexota bacterium]